jgi:hypothetical protein
MQAGFESSAPAIFEAGPDGGLWGIAVVVTHGSGTYMNRATLGADDFSVGAVDMTLASKDVKTCGGKAAANHVRNK